MALRLRTRTGLWVVVLTIICVVALISVVVGCDYASGSETEHQPYLTG